jgi:large-conductance mechanosensitive channel
MSSLQNSNNFFEFLMAALPVALGFIISSQVISLVQAFQEAFINPLIGFIIGQVALNDYTYNLTDKIELRYGKFLAASITFATTMLAAYYIARNLFGYAKPAA